MLMCAFALPIDRDNLKNTGTDGDTGLILQRI